MEVAEIPPRCAVGTIRVIELAVIDHRPEVDVASSHQDGSAEGGSVVGHKAVDVAHGTIGEDGGYPRCQVGEHSVGTGLTCFRVIPFL